MQNVKKHILLFVIIAVGFAMGITLLFRQALGSDGLNNKKPLITQVGNIKFDSLRVDTLALLSESQPDAKVQIKLSIMYAKGNDMINRSIASCGIFFPENINTDSLSLEQVAHLFMQQYVEDFKKDYRDIYSVEQGATQMNICYTVNSKIEEATEKSFAYVATVDQKNGGPRAVKVVYAKNIDIKSGRVLELEDVFVDGYHHKLSDKIVEALEKIHNVRTFAELQEKGYFAGIDAYPSKNFVIGKDAVTFIYNEDEIASHDKGEVMVTLSKTALKGILK